MFHKGTRSGAPIDWSDPEQAVAQTKIDVLRNMISCNPMSYSEKEEQVRHRLAQEQYDAEMQTITKAKEPHKNWDI